MKGAESRIVRAMRAEGHVRKQTVRDRLAKAVAQRNLEVAACIFAANASGAGRGGHTAHTLEQARTKLTLAALDVSAALIAEEAFRTTDKSGPIMSAVRANVNKEGKRTSNRGK